MVIRYRMTGVSPPVSRPIPECMELCSTLLKLGRNGVGNPCLTACTNGHIECLRYAREAGYSLDDGTLNCCVIASIRGEVECLKYAHENGCPWSEVVCVLAIQNYHLECLRYAHQNGCPWGEATVRVASQMGNADCLRYALEEGCPHPSSQWSWPIHPSVLPILYHHGVVVPGKYADQLREHRREHVRRAWTLLRCAVRWVRLYWEACERVYAPGGVGFREAESSFRRTVAVD